MSEQAAAKVTGAHLARTAYLYVRQSTLRQVLTNTESAARQYALRQKAINTSTWLSRHPVPPSPSAPPSPQSDAAGSWCSWACSHPDPDLLLSALVAKEIDYRGAFRFDTEFDESIALLAGSDALDPVITHSFDLVDAVAAMDVSAEPAISGKVVLRLSDD